MAKLQHTFPQRIGKLIEEYIIKKDGLTPNKRQQTRGYFDAYNKDTLYEIKAAKDNNYFRIKRENHNRLLYAKGIYVLVRYSLENNDKDLMIISDIKINSIKYISCNELQNISTAWLEDQRKKNLYYKVKI